MIYADFEKYDKNEASETKGLKDAFPFDARRRRFINVRLAFERMLVRTRRI